MVRALVMLAPAALLAGSATGPGPPAGAAPGQVPGGSEEPAGEPQGAGEPPSGQPDSGSAEPADVPGAPALELVEQTTWVPPDGTFSVTFRPEDLPPDATASLNVYAALSSRSDITASLAGDLSGLTLGTPVPSRPVTDLQDGSGDVTMAFELAALGLADADDYGVYPVEVMVNDADGVRVASLVTYLLRLPPEGYFPSGRLSLAVVMELGAPPALQPDGSSELSTEQLGAARDRVGALDRTDVPLTLAPVPETLDALRAERPRLLTDLERAVPGNQVLAHPYVDIDLEAWARANLVTEAPPEAEAGAKVVRDRLGLEPTPGVWLPGETIGRVESTTWAQLGVSHAILTGSALAEDPDPGQSIAPVVQLPGDVPGFVSDDVLVDRLLSVETRLDAHRVAAELAMIWAERPAEHRAIVLRLPDDRRFDPELVAYTLDLLGGEQAGPAPVVPVTTSQIAESHGSSGEAVEAPLAPKAPTEDLAWMTDQIDGARRTVAGLASTVTDPGLLTSLRRSLLVAPGAEVDAAARRGHLRRVDRAAASVADGVSAPETFRITLTAREGTIPLTLSNELDQPIDVQVRLRSNQLEFPDGTVLDVTIPPEGVRVDLQVRTRTSGAFPLDITLTSPDGNVVLDETTFNIRSTAISGVGLVLSAGAALVLVVWWARHWRRARRRNRPAEQPDPGAGTEPAPATADPPTDDVSSGPGRH